MSQQGSFSVGADGSIRTDDNAVVPSVSVDALLACRDAVLAKTLEGIAAIEAAADIARRGGLFPAEIRVATGPDWRHDSIPIPGDGVPEAVRRTLDRVGWQRLMDESGLRSFLNAKARKTWDEQLQKGEFPALSLENVQSTFAQLHTDRERMFEDGVIDTFRSLSWCYKTNRPQGFGKRLVLRHVTSTADRYSKIGYVDHRSTDRLDDLERVMSVLDGHPEPDHRNGWYSRIYGARESVDHTGASDYFRVKLHRNGNGHLTFLKLPLVDAMNRILAKRFPDALPPPRE